MKDAALAILCFAVAVAVAFLGGWKTHGAWDDAVAVQAAKMRPLYDCNMPCPIPEDKAMHPNNPKGRSK